MTSPEKPAAELYPFRYYGHRPKGWTALSRAEHHYRLFFVTPPDDDQRRELAGAFETSRLDAERGPWLWTGPWALFAVGETSDSAFFFDDVEDLLLRLHDIAPLVEAVYIEAESLSDSEWEDWSLAQRSQPEPGPLFGREGSAFVLAAAPAGGFEEPAVDTAFEQFRSDVYGLTPVDVARAELGETGIAVVPVMPGDILPPPALSPTIVTLLEPGDYAAVNEQKSGVIISSHDGAYDEATLVWDGEARLVDLPAGFGPIESAAVSPDGSCVMLCDRHRVCRIELVSGQAMVVWEAESEIALCSAAFAADGCLAVSTFDGLLLLAPTAGGGFEAVRSYPCSAGTVLPYAGGRLLLVESNELWVFGLAAGELEALATLDDQIHLVYVAGDRVFGRNPHHAVEILGLAATSAALSSGPDAGTQT